MKIELKVGQRFDCTDRLGRIRTLKIMAIVDKHIMCRYSKCIPFVKSIKEFPYFLEKENAILKQTT